MGAAHPELKGSSGNSREAGGLWMNLWRTLWVTCGHNILGLPPETRRLPQKQKLRDCYCGKRRNSMILLGMDGVTEYGGES
jgi:hypothetical protein